MDYPRTLHETTRANYVVVLSEFITHKVPLLNQCSHFEETRVSFCGSERMIDPHAMRLLPAEVRKLSGRQRLAGNVNVITHA